LVLILQGGVLVLKAPFLMVGSIIGAVVAAILHHFFDAYLDGREVWDSGPDNGWRVENAIATLVRCCFRYLLELASAK